MFERDLPNSATQLESGDQEAFRQVRNCIDLIATIRARLVRVGYFAQAVARPLSQYAEDHDLRRKNLRVLSEQQEWVKRSVALVHGSDPKGEIPINIVNWVGQFSQNHPEIRRRFTVAAELTEKLRLSCETFLAGEMDDHSKIDHDIKQHYDGLYGFFEEVTTLIDGLWEEFDQIRLAQVKRAEKASSTIDQTLARLERIGKHVRLVSLNASVEASRAGDAGKGLAVIAVEFKSLAEEIQGLAGNARSSIDYLTK